MEAQHKLRISLVENLISYASSPFPLHTYLLSLPPLPPAIQESPQIRYYVARIVSRDIPGNVREAIEAALPITVDLVKDELIANPPHDQAHAHPRPPSGRRDEGGKADRRVTFYTIDQQIEDVLNMVVARERERIKEEIRGKEDPEKDMEYFDPEPLPGKILYSTYTYPKRIEISLDDKDRCPLRFPTEQVHARLQKFFNAIGFDTVHKCLNPATLVAESSACSSDPRRVARGHAKNQGNESLLSLTNADIDQIIEIISTSQEEMFVRLMQIESCAHRPYDLVPVPQIHPKSSSFCLLSSAGFFTVNANDMGEFTRTIDWKRERHTFNLVSDMTFFRLFRVGKAFHLWKHFTYMKKREKLEKFLKSRLLKTLPFYHEQMIKLSDICSTLESELKNSKTMSVTSEMTYKEYLELCLQNVLNFRNVLLISIQQASKSLVQFVSRIEKHKQTLYANMEAFEPHKYRNISITVQKREVERQRQQYREACRLRKLCPAFLRMTSFYFKSFLIKICDEWMERNITTPALSAFELNEVPLTLKAKVKEDVVILDFPLKNVCSSLMDVINRVVEQPDVVDRVFETETQNVKDPRKREKLPRTNMGILENFRLLRKSNIIELVKLAQEETCNALKKFQSMRDSACVLTLEPQNDGKAIFERSKIIYNSIQSLSELRERVIKEYGCLMTKENLMMIDFRDVKAEIVDISLIAAKKKEESMRLLFDDSAQECKSSLLFELGKLSQRPKGVMSFLEFEDFCTNARENMDYQRDEVSIIHKIGNTLAKFMPSSVSEKLKEVQLLFSNLTSALKLAEDFIEIERPLMEDEVLKEVQTCLSVAEDMTTTILDIESDDHRENIEKLQSLMELCSLNEEKLERLVSYASHLEKEIPDIYPASKSILCCGSKISAETAMGRWQLSVNRWSRSLLYKLDINELQEAATKLKRQLRSCLSHLNESRNLTACLLDIDDFINILTTIENMFIAFDSDHYWQQVFSLLCINIGSRHYITLGHLLNSNMKDMLGDVMAIVQNAKKHKSNLTTLEKIKSYWLEYKIELQEAPGCVVSFSDCSSLEQVLENDIYALKSIGSFLSDENIVKEIDFWTNALLQLIEFSACWRNTAAGFKEIGSVIMRPKYSKSVPELKEPYEALEKEFNLELEYFRSHDSILELVFKKRGKVKDVKKSAVLFMEFFSSIIDRLGKLKLRIKPFVLDVAKESPRLLLLSFAQVLPLFSGDLRPVELSKCIHLLFPGLKSLVYNESMSGDRDADIAGYVDAFGFQVKGISTEEPIVLRQHDKISFWINQLDRAFKESFRKLFSQVLTSVRKLKTQNELWYFQFPRQIVYTVTYIMNTFEITSALEQCEKYSTSDNLQEVLYSLSQEYSHLSKLLKTDSHTDKVDFVSDLIVINLYFRDMVSTLSLKSCVSVEDFHWASKLRVYFDSDEDVIVTKLFSLSFAYKYEFIQQSSRIVMTPETEKCIHQLYAGVCSPSVTCLTGANGCGKQAILEELCHFLGRMFFSFMISSESFDYEWLSSMSVGCTMTNSFLYLKIVGRLSSAVAQKFNEVIFPKTVNSSFVNCRVSSEQSKFNEPLSVFIGISVLQPSFAPEIPKELRSSVRIVCISLPRSFFALNELYSYKWGVNIEQHDLLMFTYCLTSIENSIPTVSWGRGVYSTLNRIWREVALSGEYENESVVSKLLKSTLDVFNGIEQNNVVKRSFSSFFPLYLRANSAEESKSKGLSLKRILKIEESQNSVENDPCKLSKMKTLANAFDTSKFVLVVGRTFSGKTDLIESVIKGKQSASSESAPKMYSIYCDCMSFEEFWGRVENSCWRDGYLLSLLRQSMRGNSFNYFHLIGDKNQMFLEHLIYCCQNGESLWLSGAKSISIKQCSFVLETTSLQSCSPSVISKCSVVYMEESSILWKNIFYAFRNKSIDRYPGLKSNIHTSFVTLVSNTKYRV